MEREEIEDDKRKSGEILAREKRGIEKYGKKEYGMKEGKTLLPAIAFFEDSKQDNRFKEYKKTSEPVFLNLLNKIKVFRIRTSVVDNKLWGFEFDLLN